MGFKLRVRYASYSLSVSHKVYQSWSQTWMGKLFGPWKPLRGFKGFNGMSVVFEDVVQEGDDVIIPFKLGDLDMACACVHADESLVTIRGWDWDRQTGITTEGLGGDNATCLKDCCKLSFLGLLGSLSGNFDEYFMSWTDFSISTAVLIVGLSEGSFCRHLRMRSATILAAFLEYRLFSLGSMIRVSLNSSARNDFVHLTKFLSSFG